MWSFKKSPRPEELSTLTRTASFRCVLKPMASRSALVLGRSFGGHVYVISPPSRPNMYVVPARDKKKERENKEKTLIVYSPSQPCTRREPLTVNTKTLLTRQSRHRWRVYTAPSVWSVLLCWVMTLQSTRQHITLEQLSVPSEGLSTLMSNHE